MPQDWTPRQKLDAALAKYYKIEYKRAERYLEYIYQLIMSDPLNYETFRTRLIDIFCDYYGRIEARPTASQGRPLVADTFVGQQVFPPDKASAPTAQGEYSASPAVSPPRSSPSPERDS